MIQQVIDWLREDHEIQVNIIWNKFYPVSSYHWEVRPIWKGQQLRPYGTGGMEGAYYHAIARAIEEALKFIP